MGIYEQRPGYGQPQPERRAGEFKVIDGVKYEKVFTGYTVRQWFSHSTIEAGAGPGWDKFVANADAIFRRYGMDPDKMSMREIDPKNLPDELHYDWYPVSEE